MSKSRRHHGLFNQSDETPVILATERPTVYCMECMFAMYYKQKDRKWVLKHPTVSHCENSEKYYEIPSFPLEEVAE